ncbi:MAG: hypothetical protein ABI947_21435, partial [Chloroflexota bacterium]
GIFLPCKPFPSYCRVTSLIIALVVYAAAFLCSFAALSPKTFATYPLDPTWDAAQSVLRDKKDIDDYYNWLLGSFTVVLEKSSKPTRFKARLVQAATLFVGVDVLFIVLAKLAG